MISASESLPISKYKVRGKIVDILICLFTGTLRENESERQIRFLLELYTPKAGELIGFGGRNPLSNELPKQAICALLSGGYDLPETLIEKYNRAIASRMASEQGENICARHRLLEKRKAITANFFAAEQSWDAELLALLFGVETIAKQVSQGDKSRMAAEPTKQSLPTEKLSRTVSSISSVNGAAIRKSNQRRPTAEQIVDAPTRAATKPRASKPTEERPVKLKPTGVAKSKVVSASLEPVTEVKPQEPVTLPPPLKAVQPMVTKPLASVVAPQSLLIGVPAPSPLPAFACPPEAIVSEMLQEFFQPWKNSISFDTSTAKAMLGIQSGLGPETVAGWLSGFHRLSSDEVAKLASFLRDRSPKLKGLVETVLTFTQLLQRSEQPEKRET